jgi:hypothetical protein
MNGNIRSEFKPLPVVTGRIVCVFPSIRYVEALQKLLGERISQEPPIGWEELHNNPEAFPDKTRLVYLESDSVGKTILAMPSPTTFLCEDMFTLADGRLIVLRDQSGRKWGENGGPSQEVFDRWNTEFLWECAKEPRREG